MKKLIQLNSLITVLSLSLLISCTYAQEGSSTRTDNLPVFKKIAVRNPANVYVKIGNQQSVEVKGSQKGKDRTTIEVKGDRLIIGSERGSWMSGWSSGDRVDVYITMKEVEGLSVSGSGKLVIEDKFNTKHLDLSVSGSGNMELKTDASAIDASISGSGKIHLSGSSNNNKLSISGSGKFNAEDLESERYDISISGSGSSKIHVKSEINARISGSGSVYYKGSPSKVNSKTSGSGKVKKM